MSKPLDHESEFVRLIAQQIHAARNGHALVANVLDMEISSKVSGYLRDELVVRQSKDALNRRFGKRSVG